MHGSSPLSLLIRCAIVLVLTLGATPGIAHAEEAPPERGIVEQFSNKAAEATARYAATGNRGDLRDVSTYESNADSAMALSNEILPAAFDLRDEGVVTPVKNQGPWGTCWSFGATAACETSIMSELGWSVENGQAVDLSELHTAWFAYTPVGADAGAQAGEGWRSVSSDPNAILDLGGMLYTATSVLSSGIGPVMESDVPYRNEEGIVAKDENGTPVYYAPVGDWSVDEDKRFLQALELEESSVLPSPASKDADGSYRYNQAGTDAIKKELYAGRAVEIAFMADASMPGQADPEKYINTDTWAHYTYDENVEANHAVAIVGWDDAYSKDNFLAGHQPEHDGAWIVKNSWGSTTEEFPHKQAWGENGEGYFHLSYEDKSICVPESFNFYTETFGQRAEYYLINQYDYLPSDGVTSAQNAAETAMANVFQAEEQQRVRSLSCETAHPNTTATYELYRLDDGFADPRDGELLTTVTETYDYGGYHRVELDEGFPMGKGQYFSVVVTERCGDSYEVLTDRAINRQGAGADGVAYAVGVVNPGESYLYESGEWSDWSDDVADIKEAAAATPHGDIFDYDNFGIKAYADPMGEPPIRDATNVPDLAGLTEAEALAALEQAGLRGEAGEAEYSDAIEAGRVARQDTEAGAEVDKGYLVTYFLSLGKDPATVAPPAPENEGNPGGGESASGGEPSGIVSDAIGLASTGDADLPIIAALAALVALAAAGAVAALAITRRRQSPVRPRRRR